MSELGTPLTNVSSIPHRITEQLAKRWITSAEQLVALGHSEATVKALSLELGVGETETAAILSAARASLGPEAAKAAERPVDTCRYPLGALKPREPRHDRDP